MYIAWISISVAFHLHCKYFHTLAIEFLIISYLEQRLQKRTIFYLQTYKSMKFKEGNMLIIHPHMITVIDV